VVFCIDNARVKLLALYLYIKGMSKTFGVRAIYGKYGILFYFATKLPAPVIV
jgi:hypothetical protein